GGLCYRPDAHRMPFTFTTAKGVSPEDVLRLDAAWADVSFSNGKGGTSGVSIFQHPDNPGYPFPGWIFRHYGFLGASWPHEQTHKLAPNESFLLKYRMYVHKGGAADAKVAEKFASFSQK
ncbi:MAG: PmoA family protein, partial [Desulfobacteraceae bacterium]|nr:PmoA family protein [Desulfobacteraceae bacterium]